MKTISEQETEAILEIIEALKAMEIQLAIAHQRIAYLESQLYGGPTK